MRLKAILALILGLLFIASARAEPAAIGGFYVGVNGGPAFLQNMIVRCKPTIFGEPSLKTDVGFAVSGKVGYAFGNGLRVEGELPFRINGLSSLTSGGLSVPVSGNVTSVAFMGNVLYDFEALHFGMFTPHLGVGIGVAHVSLDNLSSGGVLLANGGSTQFAYQGIAGLRCAISPGWALDLDYTYFSTTNPGFHATNGAGFAATYHTHNITLGVTHYFSSS